MQHSRATHKTDVQRTGVGLRIKGRLTLEQWTAELRVATRKSSSALWEIGDLILHGEKAAYGEMYSRAEEVTGLSYARLTNIASVCRRFTSSRRRELLTFGPHEELIALTDAEQDRLLDAAIAGKWPRSRLREEVAKIRYEHAASAPLRSTRIQGSDRGAAAISLSQAAPHSYTPREHIPLTTAASEEAIASSKARETAEALIRIVRRSADPNRVFDVLPEQHRPHVLAEIDRLKNVFARQGQKASVIHLKPVE